MKGCRSTDCIPTLCMPGDPCLTVITIRSCLAPCGGIAGIVCEDPSQFCKFPIGTCGDGDITGECSPRSGICPAVWLPVCGCNGVTYGNECEAAAAGVSIAHPGECVRVCGGLGPAPPCEPNEFCQFPVGACGDVTTQGVCVAIPNACPEIFDPVCGCDGMTYSNACEAVRAQVSIAHPGECTACTAIRVFSDPPFTYCPSEAKRVRIVLNAPANASVIALDDQPPAGWVVSEIGQGGVFDAVNGKVKWGPIFAPFPPTLTYIVTPVESNTAGSCFAGDVSIDGFNLPICGAACLDRSCCPGLAADEVQPACDQCPAGGCETCDDACGNGRVTMCELIGYACAWRHGCNDDLAGMTRAAFIWRNGECYCWGDADNTWQPTACDLAGGASCCSAGAGANSGIEAAADPSAGATVRIRRTTGDRFSRSSEAIIEAVINPPTGTMASGLEIDVPQGWKTVKVSDGGEWDAANGKVKWGPLFGDSRTVVSVTIRREIAIQRTSRKARGGGRTGEIGLAATPSFKNFGGTVAFDGVTRPVTFE